MIGLELGSVWRRLGAKVTVVELMPTILPGNDEEIIKEADKIFRKQGLDIRVGSKVTGAQVEANRVLVDVEKDGKSEKIEADYVLVSVGRKSALTGIDVAALGPASASVEILVDAQMRTNLPNVYAIGDGGKLLAHKAEDEGVVAIEAIAGSNHNMITSRCLRRVHLARDRDGGVGRARGEGERSAVQDREVSLFCESAGAYRG